MVCISDSVEVSSTSREHQVVPTRTMAISC